MDYPVTNFYAKIHINATLSCKATLKIYKEKDYRSYLGDKQSMIIIYVKNKSPIQKPFAKNSIGKRLSGDRLIHFESRNVTNNSRFPSRSFDYNGKDYITYVGFSFNVRMHKFCEHFANFNFINSFIYSHLQQWS